MIEIAAPVSALILVAGWALFANVGLLQGSSCSMPESGDTDNFLTLVNAMDDSIRPQDQFANQSIVELWNNLSRKRECCQYLRSFNQGQSELFCGFRTTRCDVEDNVPQIVDRAR